MLEKIRLYKFGAKDFNVSDMEIEFNMLNLFTGANSTGKSFLFKAAWFSSIALNLYKVLLLSGMPDMDEIFEKEVNILFDLTFFEADELDGIVQIMDKNADIFVFTLAMNKGKLDHFQLEVLNQEKFKIGEIQSVKYNSKEARTFEAYDKYIKIKNMMGIKHISKNEDFYKLGEFYRIYDMMWFEEMNTKIKYFEENPDKLDSIYEVIEDVFGHSDGKNDLFAFQEGNSFISKDSGLHVLLPNGKTRTFSMLSAGEQSILMMSIFAAEGLATNPEGVQA